VNDSVAEAPNICTATIAIAQGPEADRDVAIEYVPDEIVVSLSPDETEVLPDPDEVITLV
jgi:hypothetical protein